MIGLGVKIGVGEEGASCDDGVGILQGDLGFYGRDQRFCQFMLDVIPNRGVGFPTYVTGCSVEGAHFGIHVTLTCSTYTSLRWSRTITREASNLDTFAPLCKSLDSLSSAYISRSHVHHNV